MLNQKGASSSRPITKRRYIYEVLREKIRSGALAPDSRVETTEVLAREFGVSYLTVHAALRDLVQDGFLVRHQGKGTFVAPAPEEKRSSSSIVAVTPIENDVIASNNSAQVLSMLRGCSLEAQQNAATLGILSLPTRLAPGDLDRCLPQIRQYGGAVFTGCQYADLMQRLSEEHFPACVIEAALPPPISHITFDRPQAIVTAIGHLVAQGHRRIGYFGAVNSHGGIKKKAYAKTLQRAGLAFEPGWVVDRKSEANTYQLIKNYLTSQSLEAVFIDNYNDARFFATVARGCGLHIPGDLAILAYGIASSTPYEAGILSHLAVPYEAMGREAVAVIGQIVRGEVRPPVTRQLATSLQIHRSCGPTSKTKVV
ncbi:MAG TPA: substrate-binding domain-containing protein [Chthoniobacteraceae bacterium]|nr:substrate-binding domain-containing protein [Chthoniobacteraceae bacterium]